MATEEGDAGTADVAYRRLVTDPALLAVFLISGTAALGTNAVPAALPSIGAGLSLSETQVGLVMSAYSLPIVFLIPVTGILADVYGRRPVVLPSLLLLGASGAATLLVDSFGVLLALRGLQGVAFAGTLPLTTTLAGDLYTGTQGSAAQGIRSGLNGLAGAVAPVVAGALAALAWQYPFLLYALAVPAAAVVYVAYPEPIEATGGSLATLGRRLGRYWRAVRAEAADRNLGVLFAGGFALFFVKQAVRTFVPVYAVRALGTSVATAGLVLGVYGGVRVVVSPLAGSVLARLGRKRAILAGIGAVAAGTVLLAAAVDARWLAVGVAVYGVGESVVNPVVNDGVAAFAPDERRAGIMSGLQSLKNVALTAAPAALGVVIAATGYAEAFLAAGALSLAYGAGVALLLDPAAA